MIAEQASSGNAQAARVLARLYRDGVHVPSDQSAAVHWFEIAAANGDEIAMHDLAMIALDLQHSEYPAKRILSLLRESASLDYPAASTALGRLHLSKFDGLLKRDALPWLKEGAQNGHAGSMQELARLYLTGELIEQDLNLAFSWATKGADLKHLGSTKVLSEVEVALRKAGSAETVLK